MTTRFLQALSFLQSRLSLTTSYYLVQIVGLEPTRPNDTRLSFQRVCLFHHICIFIIKKSFHLVPQVLHKAFRQLQIPKLGADALSTTNQNCVVFTLIEIIPVKRVVGIEGFEPPTSSSQMRRSTKLSHIPKSSLRRTSYWNAFTIDLTRTHSSL